MSKVTVNGTFVGYDTETGGSKHEQLRETGGAFYYTTRHGSDKIVGMLHSCPCGCGAIGYLNFDPDRVPARPQWKWDGNKEKPTLSPSIGIRPTTGLLNQTMCDKKFHWHGYLKKGVFKSQ